MFNSYTTKNQAFSDGFCDGLNSASVFGEQRKLEPMDPERKARWKKEVDWLLSVTEHIVELIPKIQTTNDGTQIEVNRIPNS